MEDDHLDATYLGCCWETLRPWQILHSKLADREYQKGVKVLEDVWQLMEETLDPPDPRRIEVYSKYNWWWGGEEFWGHGGVMESRIREWLAWREDEEEEGREFAITNYTYRDYLNLQSNTIMEDSQYISSRERLTIRAGEEEQEDDEVPHRGIQLTEAGIVQVEAYSAGDGGDQAEEGQAEAEESDLTYDIVSFEQAQVGTSRSLVLYNRWGAAAAANAYWRNDMEDEDKEQENEQKELLAITKLGPALDLELCPVCLEQLQDKSPLAGNGHQSLILPCRHAFHAACLQPWMRRYSAGTQPPCCPCCRAAIPANLAQPCDHHDHYDDYNEDGNHDDGHAPDIMCLLAEVEAALHRFGFNW